MANNIRYSIKMMNFSAVWVLYAASQGAIDSKQ